MNPEANWKCQKCGRSLALRVGKTAGIVMAVVVVIMIVALVFLVPVNHAKLVVHVNSTHITQTVHYYVYVNGQQRAEGNLAPGYSVVWSLDYGWSLTGSNQVTIQTMSTGGGLGEVEDSKTILVGSGSTYEITLNA